MAFRVEGGRFGSRDGSGSGNEPTLDPGSEEWSDGVPESEQRPMDPRCRHQAVNSLRVGITGFKRLPVLVTVGKTGEPKQRQRRLAGVRIRAKDEEIGHT